MEKVIITTFTDPMMGLSYECEPIFRKLETHFGGTIGFRYIMSGLVRDVYDFVNPDDLKDGNEAAIDRYNIRLAKIYEEEETISGMPINMTDFHLFSVEHTSSIPLNLAYKTVQLIAPEKADLFLYNLRYATIVDCRPTTRLEEILDVVTKMNIDKDVFLKQYNSDAARESLNRDLQFGQSLGIHTLPSYLVQYGEKTMLIRRLIGYDDFTSCIGEISDGKVCPRSIIPSITELDKLIKLHPLISPIEIREAFDFETIDEVREFIKPLIANEDISIIEVYHGWFIKRRDT